MTKFEQIRRGAANEKDAVLYILRAMHDRHYKPKVNPHTGTDYNDMNRWALEKAMEAVEKEGNANANV
jgi:hypothetical protein